MTFSKSKRNTIVEIFNGRCAYCGELSGALHIDHKIPKSKGGTNSLDNLYPACSNCNCFKSDKNIEEFRIKILTQINKFLNTTPYMKIAINSKIIKIKKGDIKFYFEVRNEMV